MLLTAPAKVNLTLEVLARREDGYHGVRSLMVPLDLADELCVEPAAAFAFSCDVPEIADEDNLALRAIRALGSQPEVSIELRKRIPAQAGLGGGSSDAAAVLLAALDGAFGRRYEQVDWIGAARSLGSDVPFFLARTGALVEGTGERVTPVGALPPWGVLIVKPPVAVPTADAYARLDAAPRPSRARASSASLRALEALQRADLAAVGGLLQNDFHDVVATGSPEIALALHALRAAGAARPLLAGSGSCVFALTASQHDAVEMNERLDLPDDYRRFATRFATTPEWRA